MEGRRLWTYAIGLVIAYAAACGRARARPVEPPPVQVLNPDKRAPGERFPLVVFLHGLGGSAADGVLDSATARLARRHRMVVVAPDGDVDRQGRQFWNAGGACCNFDRSAVDDVARLTALVDRWRQRPEIDPARIYVVGFSNGGFMAHRLACRISDRLAAVVSLAGAGVDPKEACAAGSPIGVLEVHGDADPIVRYEGGRVFDSAALAPHPSASQTMGAWAERLGCAKKPVAGGSSSIATQVYPGCRSGRAELWTVKGGGHHVVTPEIIDSLASWLASSQRKPR